MQLARGREHEVFDRAIDVQVSRLRKLVEPDPANPRYIQTVWGFGYVYVPDDDPAARQRDGPAPRSLFGRLTLLLVAVVAIATVSTIVLFRQDRAALIARQFGDTKIVQLQALRAALEAAEARAQRATLHAHRSRVRRAHRSRGGAAEFRRRARAQPARRRAREPAAQRAGTGDRAARAAGPAQFLVRLDAGGTAYWARFRARPRATTRTCRRARCYGRSRSSRCCWSPRSCSRAISRGRCANSTRAVERVGRGETPAPLPETGPAEIGAVNRGFNAMLANLRQIERDRAVLLAGVSHDLRTPLARLRLGRRDGRRGRRRRAGMVADIEEMDRIIGQFLDFARGRRRSGARVAELDALVAGFVERYAARARTSAFTAGGVPPLPLTPTALSRLVRQSRRQRSRVRRTAGRGHDRGGAGASRRSTCAIAAPASPPRPRRATEAAVHAARRARARDDGAAGAGLGLAIVDRIARLHGGRFDLLPREGGGTIARVTLATSR